MMTPGGDCGGEGQPGIMQSRRLTWGWGLGSRLWVMKGDNQGSSRSKCGLRSERGTLWWLYFQEDEMESLRYAAATPNHRAPKEHSRTGVPSPDAAGSAWWESLLMPLNLQPRGPVHHTRLPRGA